MLSDSQLVGLMLEAICKPCKSNLGTPFFLVVAEFLRITEHDSIELLRKYRYDPQQSIRKLLR